MGKFLPDFSSFSEAFARGEGQLVWKVLPADLHTPVSAMLQIEAHSPYAMLFESVEQGATRARYSFIALSPNILWECREGVAYRREQGKETRLEGAPLSSLRAFIEESRFVTPQGLPSMVAGVFGYMGYDMVRQMERLPDNNPDAIGIPEGLFMRPQVVVVFDSVRDEMVLATPVYPGGAAKSAYEAAETRIAEIEAVLHRPLPKTKAEKHAPLKLDYEHLERYANMPRKVFHQMVEKAREYILSGDIFQVVLSQRFRIDFPYAPMALYRALRRLNPAPFSFFGQFNGYALVGASPEILVRLKDGVVTIRPIAGTRGRGATLQEDRALAADLLSDGKELAEHLMLLDLGRNDVGRVAEGGTVKVTEREIIEYYSHVMHIVSNVEGRLKQGKDALDALAAGFPAGTVSGAPKVRAMEIIDELEPERRSFYAGCVGYFAADGTMDTCIALRTGLVKDGTLYVQAGGGIVADSTPEGEYQESCNKARALLRAAEEASVLAEKGARA